MLKSVVVLAVATVALLGFMLALRDLRWRQRAMEQAQWHADILAERVGDAGVLPLNLGRTPTPGQTGTGLRLERLSRPEARVLRDSDQRVLVAQIIAPRLTLARDGKAVVLFEDGRFVVEWLTLSELERVRAAQREELRRLGGEATGEPPGG